MLISRFIVNDILGAIRLGLESNWRLMFSDGTNQRQCALYNLLFAIKNDWSKGFELPMIVPLCIVMMEETVEGIQDAIHCKVDQLRYSEQACKLTQSAAVGLL